MDVETVDHYAIQYPCFKRPQAAFYFTLLNQYETGWYGFPISTFIPLAVAWPTSTIVINLMDRLDAANQQLNLQNTFRSQLLGIIAHDVRSPLAVLVNLIDLYEDDLTPAEFNDLIKQLKPQLSFTQDTLDRLTLWVKMRMDDEVLEISEFTLKELESTLKEYGHRWGEFQNSRLEIEWNPTLKISADIQAVLIALTNLINNAMKFSPTDVAVKLGSSGTDDKVVLTVTDEGRGIPPKILSQLFRHKSMSNDARIKGGMGVGLFLSREFVQMVGGELDAKNLPGKGAQFSITLKRA